MHSYTRIEVTQGSCLLVAGKEAFNPSRWVMLPTAVLLISTIEQKFEAKVIGELACRLPVCPFFLLASGLKLLLPKKPNFTQEHSFVLTRQKCMLCIGKLAGRSARIDQSTESAIF
jgi:hypothetical protein